MEYSGFMQLWMANRKMINGMVEIEGKILNTYISILIDPSACQSYVSPKIVDVCKIGKEKLATPWLVQLATGTK